MENCSRDTGDEISSWFLISNELITRKFSQIYFDFKISRSLPPWSRRTAPPRTCPWSAWPPAPPPGPSCRPSPPHWAGNISVSSEEAKYLMISHVSGVEVIVVIIVSDPTVLSQVPVRPWTHLVEDVEVPLPGILTHHARLLQQEVGYLAPGWLTSIKQDLNILSL